MIRYSIIYEKILGKVRVHRAYLNIIKAIHTKSTATLYSMGKNLKAFPLRTGTRKWCPHSTLLFNIVLEILARAIK